MLVDKSATLYTPIQYTNCNSRMSGRIIMVMLVLVHRLLAVMNADKDLNYSSLTHYRNAASKRSTFHRTLLWCAETIKEGAIGKKVSFEEDVVVPEQQPTSKRHKQVDGIVPEKINFGSKQTFKTPKKQNTQRS